MGKVTQQFTSVCEIRYVTVTQSIFRRSLERMRRLRFFTFALFKAITANFRRTQVAQQKSKFTGYTPSMGVTHSNAKKSFNNSVSEKKKQLRYLKVITDRGSTLFFFLTIELSTKKVIKIHEIN